MLPDRVIYFGINDDTDTLILMKSLQILHSDNLLSTIRDKGKVRVIVQLIRLSVMH